MPAQVQAGRNPSLYGIKPGENLDAQLKKGLLAAVRSLVQHGLVRTSHRAMRITFGIIYSRRTASLRAVLAVLCKLLLCKFKRML